MEKKLKTKQNTRSGRRPSPDMVDVCFYDQFHDMSSRLTKKKREGANDKKKGAGLYPVGGSRTTQPTPRGHNPTDQGGGAKQQKASAESEQKETQSTGYTRTTVRRSRSRRVAR